MDDPKLAAADQLYTVPPHRFVAERTTAVAAARAAGDRETATALAKLRRPSVAAWLVNLLALRRPELLEELAQLADSMRTAQRELAGRQLRQLTARRRATVAGLVAEARALGLAADPQLTAGKLPLAEVEATLQSGLADPAVAGRLRSGRLVRAMSASGFGELPPPRLATRRQRSRRPPSQRRSAGPMPRPNSPRPGQPRRRPAPNWTAAPPTSRRSNRNWPPSRCNWPS